MKKLCLILIICMSAFAFAGNTHPTPEKSKPHRKHSHHGHKHRHRHHAKRDNQTPPPLPPEIQEGFHLGSIVPTIKTRLHTIEKNINKVPEHLRGFVSKFKDNYREMKNHYRTGGTAIDKKTYQRIDEGLAYIEREAKLPEIKTHLHKIEISSEKKLFDQLPELDQVIMGQAQKIVLKKALHCAGLGTLSLLILYKAYHYCQAYEGQIESEEPSLSEQSTQQDETLETPAHDVVEIEISEEI